MGRDKRLLRPWGDDGPTLLERATVLLAPHCDEVIVTIGADEDWGALRGGAVARFARDGLADAGPLAGIVAGMTAMRGDLALVLACDMPRVRNDMLRGLLAATGGGQCIVPLRPGGDARNAMGAEPLLAVYAREALETLRAALGEGERSPAEALLRCDVRYLPPDVWHDWDADGVSFDNLNTAGDLTRRSQDARGSAA